MVPVVILIVLFALYEYEQLIFLIIFFIPLSIQLKDIIPVDMLDMSLPTEPLIFGAMLIFFVKLIVDRTFDKKIYKHPVSIAIYFYMGWMLITSITSTMPLVSFKFFLSRLWFIVVFYFLASQIFKNIKKIDTYIWLYLISLFIVVVYSLYNLSEYGFWNQKMAHSVMRPFYNDHTSYSAIIAMFFPILIGFVIGKNEEGFKKYMAIFFLIVFTFAIILSYSRAAWLSLVSAFVFWVLIKKKIKFRSISITILVLAAISLIFKDEIFSRLKNNKQDSSTNITQHIQSISNVSTDASNVERLNRWNCAFRMFAEKPIFGWGPGSYTFQYAPFQHSDEKTIISTNHGDRGNAHSEYIGPLAESGILGLVFFIAIVLTTIHTSVNRVYRKSQYPHIRSLCLVLLLSLVTYYFHGLLNNFLDTDKASALFWGFTSMIVVIDVYHNKKIEEKLNESTNEANKLSG